MSSNDLGSGFGNLSEQFFAIEALLDRIERSGTYYQVLGLDRNASRDHVVSAYREMVMALSPVFNELRSFVPQDQFRRTQSALAKAGEAYYNLFSQSRRTDYDKWLRGRISDPGLPHVTGTEASFHTRASGNTPGSGIVDVDNLYRPATAGAVVSHRDRRRFTRLNVRLTGRIIAHNSTGERYFVPVETINVCKFGAAIKSTAPLRIGNIVSIGLPMPIKLRTHSYADTAYQTYAIVKRVHGLAPEAKVLGMEFLGKQAPSGYLQNPCGVFRMGRWSGPDRRREQRIKLIEQVTIDYLDEFSELITTELVVTDNVGPGGARVSVKAAPAEFEYARIKSSQLNFEGIGLVSDRYRDAGIERICLRFSDAKWPVAID